MLFRSDYAAAGIPMLPVVRGIDATTRQIAAYSMYTVACSFALTATGDLGRFYAAAAAVLGVVFVARAVALRRDPSPQRAIRFFGLSNIYLTLLFVAIAVDPFLS